MKLSKQEFTQKYIVLEGSHYGAKWVLTVLDTDGDGDITLSEVKKNLGKVQERYKEKLMKDISGICIYFFIKRRL